MKELNIQEKARRYDEALEKGKQIQNTPYTAHWDIMKEVVEYLLPELKESEDDKIVDAIRKALESKIEDLGSGVTKTACLAWLEKQGEQKTVDPIVSFKASDWYVSKVDGKIYNAKFMEEPPINQKRKLDIEKAAFSATGIIEQEEWFIKGAEWSDKNPLLISSEKQGKQKPVECCADKLWTEFQKQVAYLMASSYNREYEYTKGYVEWVAQSLLGYAKNEIEQKPAWSEEDESMLYGVIETEQYMLDVVNGIRKFDVGNDDIRKACAEELNWLKSLKDRVQPQNTWKPSEEQMRVLEKVVNGQVLFDNQYNSLKDLLEQLKK